MINKQNQPGLSALRLCNVNNSVYIRLHVLNHAGFLSTSQDALTLMPLDCQSFISFHVTTFIIKLFMDFPVDVLLLFFVPHLHILETRWQHYFNISERSRKKSPCWWTNLFKLPHTVYNLMFASVFECYFLPGLLSFGIQATENGDA